MTLTFILLKRHLLYKDSQKFKYHLIKMFSYNFNKKIYSKLLFFYISNNNFPCAVVVSTVIIIGFWLKYFG
ncbi:hypothetical protein COM83_02515 [Bacillus cereus]|nr:hypothetical protein COM83_02515 [Bacillus cereus]PEB79525.1 hypothetical protein COM95_21260 [Bacillus cereus]PEX42165.1 hypothetical protein CN464_26330 [Bacillus cereus]PEX94732.1 hypothetical protein CN465_16740 [Bacillus cereus]PFJ45913.1 hypothetical protein COI99_27250 [Bacillus cereus]